MIKFYELAENKLKHAGPKDKTINIKIAINTARMMVENERPIRRSVEQLMRESEFYKKLDALVKEKPHKKTGCRLQKSQWLLDTNNETFTVTIERGDKLNGND